MNANEWDREFSDIGAEAIGIVIGLHQLGLIPVEISDKVSQICARYETVKAAAAAMKAAVQ